MCGKKVKYTNEKYIELCLEDESRHGLYDYSKVVYDGMRKKVTIICNRCKLEFRQRAGDHKNGKGCPHCNKKKVNRVRTKWDFLNRAIEMHGVYYDYRLALESWEGVTKKMPIICPVHGIFYQTGSEHIRKGGGRGCKECGYDNQRLGIKPFISKAITKHGTKYKYHHIKEYKNNTTPVPIECPKCGIFHQAPTDHLKGFGCGTCKESRGEAAIARFLDKKGIFYEREYKFEDCSHINQLRFDFWLPNKNILIEYNGRQHYESIESWGGEETLRKRKIRDGIKLLFTKQQKIRFLVIPYTDFKNVDNILKSFLKE